MSKNVFINSLPDLTKIDVKDLQVGMHVSELDRPWLESSFIFQGFELKNTADIDEVRAQCEFVYVDALKSKKSDRFKAKKTAYSQAWVESRHPPTQTSNFTEEFNFAESVFHEMSDLVKGFMEEVTFGRAINVEIAKTVVAKCVQSVIKSPDALMWLTQLKSKDEYTSQHSMNVCVYSIALGRQINLSKEKLEDLGLCGMMHDMGKIKIPQEVLNKPGRFEPKELAIMQSHAALGAQLLMSSERMPGCVIDTAYAHHERLDGTGYPRGLIAQNIHPYTRIISIADVYDAVISDRVYRKGKTHLETINILIELAENQLDSGLVTKFIECLGIYPPGSIVEMTNGEVAVVIETHKMKKLKPKVTMLLDEDKQRVKPRLVDLAKIDLDAIGKSYVVKRIVRPDEYDIDLSTLYKMDLIKKVLSEKAA